MTYSSRLLDAATLAWGATNLVPLGSTVLAISPDGTHRLHDEWDPAGTGPFRC